MTETIDANLIKNIFYSLYLKYVQSKTVRLHKRQQIYKENRKNYLLYPVILFQFTSANRKYQFFADFCKVYIYMKKNVQFYETCALKMAVVLSFRIICM